MGGFLLITSSCILGCPKVLFPFDLYYMVWFTVAANSNLTLNYRIIQIKSCTFAPYLINLAVYTKSEFVTKNLLKELLLDKN